MAILLFVYEVLHKIVKLIELTQTHTSFFLNALGYTPIPTAIPLTDSGLISHQTVTITTDIDCPRTYSGSIEADCTTRDRCTAH